MKKYLYIICKSTTVHLLACAFCALLFENILPLPIVQIFYTLSTVAIQLLSFFIPVLIFVFLSSSCLKLNKKAPFYLILLVLSVVLSNCISLLISYGAGSLLLPLCSFEVSFNTHDKITLIPLFQLPQAFIRTDITALIAFIFSVFVLFYPFSTSAKDRIRECIESLHITILEYLSKLIPFLLPLYTFGFMLKMLYDGTFSFICNHYLPVLIITLAIITTYLVLVYYISSLLIPQSFFQILSNMVPAALTAFTSMSSAATLPLTLLCTDKNLKDQKLSQFILSNTVNTHIIGDNIIIVMSALALLFFFGKPIPDLYAFLNFIVFFSILNLSSIGVPGGNIIVIMPIIQQYLRLPQELCSILIALYIMQDPLITLTNVMGNGAFAIIFGRFLKKEDKNKLHTK
jgi:Na+/H+-dicarboxylate symporter